MAENCRFRSFPFENHPKGGLRVGKTVVRATSLWQPWATGIAVGVKGIETRGFATKHRGELAIHAAKRWASDQRAFAERARAMGWIKFGLPFGAIVAVVDVIDVRRAEQLIHDLDPVEQVWGDYGPNRYGWLLANVRPLRNPVPCRGQQGMWELDTATAQAVRDQIGAAA